MLSGNNFDPPRSAVSSRRYGKDDLKNRLRGVISDIPIERIDDRKRVNEDLRRITSLEISGPMTDYAQKEKPTIEEIIEEMEIEFQRLINMGKVEKYEV